MGLTWLEGFPPSEAWCVLDGASIREAVEARWSAMLRAALFTISPQYLHDASKYSHRLTLVFRGPVLLAFAFLNVESVDIPDVSSWSGQERLSFWAPSLSGLRKKSKGGPGAAGGHGKSRACPRVSTTVAHLGAIACSPHSTDALGSRLMRVQKWLAYQMLSGPVRLLALEAIKPLDTDYYGRFGFQTSTATFWSVSDPVSLVPMVYKLLDSDGACAAVYLGPPVVPVDRSKNVQEDGPWASAAPIASRMSDFMWRCKDHDAAFECLRTLCKRLSLTDLECQKLWSMRHHSLMYGRPESMKEPKQPLHVPLEWFVKSSLSLDDATIHALSKALHKL